MRLVSVIFAASIIDLYAASVSSVPSSSVLDKYGSEVPLPVISGGIRFSVPAVQGMESNHVSFKDVTDIIGDVSPDRIPTFVTMRGITALLRSGESEGRRVIEVSSVWRD